ncbi:putative ankyrin and het domain protein [Botrytis fragariae]|uniref:Putative ankyrin and het domain protein n=1 Tax=Botrytis fragariae TaxID=1964551 RepID=A0A8H6AJJ7_9HELO|nr:putative ankyrin and het domain protein [Botrytis fragariae]KAF5868465.1 putative ankyrin and het domain protein [Botrytis fragariae]
MPSPYADLPLLHPDKQIRLLRLEQSSSDGDDYCFSLTVHNFCDDVYHPRYIAISYTWGDFVPLMPIIVNGKRMRVRFNCWYALWQMRHHGVTDYLWIDSLCINQDNNEEKNFQVAIMGSIYESALWVASCIGTGDTIGAIQPTSANDGGEEARIAREKLRGRFDQIPYFDRVWIKQEIILARDITLFYGLKSVSWEIFNTLMSIEQRLSGQNSEESADCGMFDALENSEYASSSFYRWGQIREYSIQEAEMNSTTLQLCNHRSNTKSGTFVDLVLRYKTAKATNPRDKIYALLSLLPKEDFIRQNMVIDYEQPTFHLFHAVARLVYSTHEDLEIGQKHQVLELIREWLDINEHNLEMDEYLRSIPPSPSVWLPSSTSDLTNPWLEAIDPHVRLDIKELCQIPQQDELHANLNIQAEEYAPLTLLEHINTWRQNDEKWSKEHINELLPANLKTSRVTIMWPNLQTDIFPAMKEFLVNADVRDGDFIAKIVWGKSEIIYNAADHWTAAYAVLRNVKVKENDKELDKDDDSIMDTSDDVLDGSSNCELEQEQGTDAFLALHSWAIPVSQDLKILTEDENSDLSDIYRNQNPGVLILHHRDALIPLILNDRPLHALLYPAPAGSYLSTIQLDNNVKCKSEPPLKQLSDYISDVFG